MESLPKYYFGDIPADIAQEIVDAMRATQPKPDIEEIDHWINCRNAAATIPDWYDRIAEFKDWWLSIQGGY